MINVYDFDGTIYDGDSSIDFYIYCLIKSPLLLRYVPSFILAMILYVLKLKNKEYVKEKFFIINKGIKDIDSYIETFWDVHKVKIKSWYIKQKKSTDVIISASPEFLLKPICTKLGISSVISTKVNKNNGILESKNCHGYEKIRRYEEQYPKNSISNFYTDSYKSDMPMLKYAKIGYIVKKNKVMRWNND